MRIKIFGYEPPALIGVVEAFLALLLSLHVLGLTGNTVALIMAVVTAGFGLATAAMTRDRLLSAIVGFAKAAVMLGVGYGLPLTDVQTSAVIAFVTVTAGLFLRTQTESVETKLSHASAGAKDHRRRNLETGAVSLFPLFVAALLVLILLVLVGVI